MAGVGVTMLPWRITTGLPETVPVPWDRLVCKEADHPLLARWQSKNLILAREQLGRPLGHEKLSMCCCA